MNAMNRKILTPAEVAALQKNPCISSATSKLVRITPEFMKTMYEGKIAGKPIAVSLQEHGIDPEVLGESRLQGIANHLKHYASREEGFADLRSTNSRKPAQETVVRTLEERVEQLEHEVAYDRQQIEFLKKIHLADLEARKLWESKLNRKKNSQ